MVTQSIPADRIVKVTPGVVGVGGTGLVLNGLILTDSTRAPIGSVQSFGSPDTVSSYFGPTSTEYLMAVAYFNSFDISSIKPGALLFAQFPLAPVAGYTRGGSGLTLAAVTAITPATMTVLSDGVSKVSSAINLSGAVSLSDAATIIQAAFTSPGFVVTYDSLSGGFIITSSTTGAASSIAVTTGAMATALKLTAATGAVVSAGAIAAVPATFMMGIANVNQNFISFSTTFEPATNIGLAFAAWTSGQNNRYIFVGWDIDVLNLSNAPTATLAALVKAANYGGSIIVYSPLNQYLMGGFVMGYFASLNFTEQAGRTTLDARTQNGLTADVTDAASFDILKTNGLNFYGAFSSANDTQNLFVPGSISGQFLWADSYANQVWLNAALQLSLLNLLQQAKAIPYNNRGYAMVASACQDPIQNALNFGAIQIGVTLSLSQAAQVNNSAGLTISDQLTNDGYYLQILDADPTVRAARGSPPIKLWYMDGQSIQTINLNSLEVQ